MLTVYLPGKAHTNLSLFSLALLRAKQDYYLLFNSAEKDKQLFKEEARNFNNIILAFNKPEKPLIPPLIFPFTVQWLVSDDFFL